MSEELDTGTISLHNSETDKKRLEKIEHNGVPLTQFGQSKIWSELILRALKFEELRQQKREENIELRERRKDNRRDYLLDDKRDIGKKR